MWEGLDPKTAALEEVFQPVFEMSKRQPHPWSTCELRLSRSEIEWLRRWISVVHPAQGSWLTNENLIRAHPFTWQQAFGGLILIIAAEVCRDESNEEEVWPPVRRLFPNEGWGSLQSFLFPGGQPSQNLKEAMEAASEILGLRNVFGIEGSQQYFLTVKLQFGFTRSGFRRHLHRWLLAQGVPLAVQRLQDDSLRSDTFVHLWNILKAYRQDSLDKERALSELRGSPWVRVDWLEDLLNQARARLDLGLGSQAERHDSDDKGLSVVRSITLDWPSGVQPTFWVELDRELVLNEIGTSGSDTVHFSIDGMPTRSWTLTNSSRWEGDVRVASFHPNRKLNLAPAILSISSPDGKILYEEQLDSPISFEGEFSIYDLWEQRALLGTESLRQSRDYVLICSKPVSLRGATPSDKYNLDNGHRLLRISAGWPQEMNLARGQEELWRPTLNDAPTSPNLNLLVRTPIANPVEVGSLSYLEVIGVPDDTERVVLVVEGREFPASHQTEVWRTTEEVPITPTLVMEKPLRVRIHGAESTTQCTPKTEFRIIGVICSTSIDSQEWVIHDSKTPMTIATGSKAWLFFRSGTESLELWEGARKVEFIKHGRKGDLLNLSPGKYRGWGETLTLRHGSQKLCVTECLVNRGVIEGFEVPITFVPSINQNASIVVRQKKSSQPSIRFRHDVPPSNSAYCVWALSGPEAELPLESVNLAKGVFSNVEPKWTGELPEGALAVGVSFHGARIGASWQVDALRETLKTRTISSTYFACLRWLRAPVLSSEIRKEFFYAALSYLPNFIAAWHSGTGLPHGLLFPEEEETVPVVLQAVLWDWRPSRIEVQSLVKGLRQTPSNIGRRMTSLMVEFAGIAPVLVDAISRNTENEEYCLRALRKIWSLSPDAGESEISRRDMDLMTYFTISHILTHEEVMTSIDELLTAIHANKPLASEAREHLQHLCQIEYGPRYLSGRLIVERLK